MNENTHSVLKPCLVLGTGFHRWVLGDAATKVRMPLVDWNALLDATALGLGVASTSYLESPTLKWERLLLRAVEEGTRQHGRQSLAVHKLEVHAKRAAAKVIQEHSEQYPKHSRRAQLPLAPCWGAVVSFNFDAAWLQAGDPLAWSYPQGNDRRLTSVRLSPSLEQARMCRFHSLDGRGSRRLWFPNGAVSVPGSLRLGLRDFGL